MREKGDEKFFTNLEIYGNIKPEIQLQFYFKKLKFKKFEKSIKVGEQYACLIIAKEKGF